jgi:hypothetical protein
VSEALLRQAYTVFNARDRRVRHIFTVRDGLIERMEIED